MLRSLPQANTLLPNHPVVFATRSSSAVIEIGEECGFAGVTIGRGSSIGAGSVVSDNIPSNVVAAGVILDAYCLIISYCRN